MPFEPLGTDEKLDAPAKKAKDIDTVLLAGCFGFVLTSIGTYLLSAWPYFAMPDLRTLDALIRTCAIGLLPATVAGAVAARKFGLPGACGFFAGSMATAIFIVLRIQQVFLLGQTKDELMPTYPFGLIYFIALGWLIFSLIVALLAMPKNALE